jgi:hypothetical protein
MVCWREHPDASHRSNLYEPSKQWFEVLEIAASTFEAGLHGLRVISTDSIESTVLANE